MKNILLISSFLIMFWGSAAGQFRVGPLAGFSTSRFIYEDDTYKKEYETASRPGYNLGFVLNYRVNKLYSLQTEISYVQKGVDVRYQDENVKVHNQLNYQYISSWALLRLSSHKMLGNQHVEIYGNIGPEVNYWLGGSGKLETTERTSFTRNNALFYQVDFNEKQGDRQSMLVEDPYRLQMSLGAGGGVIFDLGQVQHLALDVRGSFGIGKSFHGKQEGGDYGLNLYSENLEGLHHTISISASYLLNLDLDILFRKGKFIRK